VAGGDFEQSIFGGANYGRDCDSIASMAGAIAGTLHGVQTIRPAWIRQVNSINRCDFTEMALGLAALTSRLQRDQLEQSWQREQAFAHLLTNA
jgi:ADP-ribosylglycohydrolase